MKRNFARNYRNVRFYIELILWVILTVVLSCFPTQTPYWILSILLLPLFFLRYSISDKGILKGYGHRIPIQTIQKLVDQPDGVDVYYQLPESKKIRMIRFYVKDHAGFVKSLQNIHPSILSI